MAQTINIASIGNVYIDDLPNVCPVCHHAMEPFVLAGTVTGDPNELKTELQVALRCGYRGCLSIFIGYYGGVRQGPRTSGVWHLQGLAPRTPVTPSFPPEVSALSPQFVRVFGQAATAEAFGLDEIAGGGYRKALEFLVKDYCCSRSPDAADAIRKKLLGSVIQEYIEDAGIKQCARRAAWLGNDETHYIRKWETKDISDLKALIALTVSWIQTNLLTERYLKDMPEGGQ